MRSGEPPKTPHDRAAEGGRYRSYPAQDIHHLVLQFLHGKVKTADVFEAFTYLRKMAKLTHSIDPFITTSIHGHTVLIDALHLARPIAQQYYPEPQATAVAIEKANCLLELIFASAMDINSKRFLLTKADEYGLTPVHAILLLGDSTMLRSLFEQVEECLTPEEVRDFIYAEHEKAMRIWNNNNAALYGTIPEYFNFLFKQFNKGVLNANDLGRFLSGIDDYKYSFFYKILLTQEATAVANAINCLKILPLIFPYRILMQCTRDRHTVMHFSCALSDEAILIEILAFARQLVLDQTSNYNFTVEEYSSLFCLSTHAGFASVHFVFGNKNPRLVEIYIREIEWATAEGFVPIKNLKALWLAVADNKSTALSYAIESGNHENVQAYLTVLSRLHRINHPDAITYNELLTIIQKPTLNGRSILHLAAETGNLRIIQELVKFIRLEMIDSAAEVLTNLFNMDPHRNLPHCPLQDEKGVQVNQYLTKLRTLTTIKNPAELDQMLSSYEYKESAATTISTTYIIPGTLFSATPVAPAATLPIKQADFSTDIPPAAPPPPLPGEKRQQFDNKNVGGTPKVKR